MLCRSRYLLSLQAIQYLPWGHVVQFVPRNYGEKNISACIVGSKYIYIYADLIITIGTGKKTFVNKLGECIVRYMGPLNLRFYRARHDLFLNSTGDIERI